MILFIQVVSVGRDQFGMYTCEAKNRHGASSKNMELYETKSPICPPLCGKTDLYASASNIFISYWMIFAISTFTAISIKQM